MQTSVFLFLQTQCVLSTDLCDKLSQLQETYGVTTSGVVKGPVARNVFIIEP